MTLTSILDTRYRGLILIVLPAAIASAQLTLMLRTPGAGDFIVINLLAWICAGYLWIDQLEKTNPPAWARTAPLALVPLCWSLLVISRPFTLYDSLLNAVPLATLVGLGLILPAKQKLRWSLVLVGLLPFFHYALLLLVPLDPLSKSTASLSASILWLGGLKAFSVDNLIWIDGNSLLVAGRCTALNAISLSLASVLALLLLNGPLSPRRGLVLLLAAPTLAIAVNAVRIALLGVTSLGVAPASLAKSPTFIFWHTGDGATLFGLLTVMLVFGLEHLLRRAVFE